MSWPVAIGLILVSYLLGAIPVGLLLARLKGVDIRRVGSGNIGATNVFRSVSKPLGMVTFAADALKGFVPAFVFPIIGKMLDPDFQALENLGLVCGCAAFAGHNWPVYLGFKGGKGVATSAGVLLGVAPAAVGIGLAVWVALLLASRIVSAASIGAAVAVPAAGWWLYGGRGRVLPITLTVLGALVIWRHRSNIQRLLAGTEHRFEFGRGQRSEGQRVNKEI
jgi:glycerol-3-phosphate acyltransferase PlsY